MNTFWEEKPEKFTFFAIELLKTCVIDRTERRI